MSSISSSLPNTSTSSKQPHPPHHPSPHTFKSHYPNGAEDTTVHLQSQSNKHQRVTRDVMQGALKENSRSVTHAHTSQIRIPPLHNAPESDTLSHPTSPHSSSLTVTTTPPHLTTRSLASSTSQKQGNKAPSSPLSTFNAPPCIFVYGKQPQALYRQRHDQVGSWGQFLKIIFVGFVLQWFWIRALGITLSFFISFALVCSVALVTRKKYEQLTGFSRYIFNVFMKLGSRGALFFFGVFHLHREDVSKEDFDRIRERYTTIPREAEQALNYPPFYVISNHVSITDPLIHLIIFGPLSIVCKESIKHIPFFGQALQLIQCIFVSPDNTANVNYMKQREQSYIQRASAAALPTSRPGKAQPRNVPPQLLIFPEGTTTSGFQIIRFHSGAFKSGLPVQPVYIDYPFKHFNMSWTKLTYRYAFYALGQVYNTCRVFVLPPYVPNEAEKADWRLYAYNVQRVLVDVGNLYRPLNAPMQASDELFFRYPPRGESQHVQERTEIPAQPLAESSLSREWRLLRERAREFGEAESLQSPTPFDESAEYMRQFEERRRSQLVDLEEEAKDQQSTPATHSHEQHHRVQFVPIV